MEMHISKTIHKNILNSIKVNYSEISGHCPSRKYPGGPHDNQSVNKWGYNYCVF
jgi:hypothetical protein